MFRRPCSLRNTRLLGRGAAPPRPPRALREPEQAHCVRKSTSSAREVYSGAAPGGTWGYRVAQTFTAI